VGLGVPGWVSVVGRRRLVGAGGAGGGVVGVGPSAPGDWDGWGGVGGAWPAEGVGGDPGRWL